jgi:hypothetical protein
VKSPGTKKGYTNLPDLTDDESRKTYTIQFLQLFRVTCLP